MTPESQSILDTLLAEGWKEYPESRGSKRRLLAKSFAGYAKCRCNAPKDKQVEIYFHPAEGIGRHLLNESWSVENVGELPDGEWLRMKIEGFHSQAAIEQAVSQLLSGWDHVVSITPPRPHPET